MFAQSISAVPGHGHCTWYHSWSGLQPLPGSLGAQCSCCLRHRKGSEKNRQPDVCQVFGREQRLASSVGRKSLAALRALSPELRELRGHPVGFREYPSQPYPPTLSGKMPAGWAQGSPGPPPSPRLRWATSLLLDRTPLGLELLRHPLKLHCFLLPRAWSPGQKLQVLPGKAHRAPWSQDTSPLEVSQPPFAGALSRATDYISSITWRVQILEWWFPKQGERATDLAHEGAFQNGWRSVWLSQLGAGRRDLLESGG